jgi:hypothetical protein
MKYQYKPVAVEAFIWTGDEEQTEDPEWIIKALESKKVEILNSPLTGEPFMLLETKLGLRCALPGYYIVREENGNIFPCKPKIFTANYEQVVS